MSNRTLASIVLSLCALLMGFVPLEDRIGPRRAVLQSAPAADVVGLAPPGYTHADVGRVVDASFEFVGTARLVTRIRRRRGARLRREVSAAVAPQAAAQSARAFEGLVANQLSTQQSSFVRVIQETRVHEVRPGAPLADSAHPDARYYVHSVTYGRMYERRFYGTTEQVTAAARAATQGTRVDPAVRSLTLARGYRLRPRVDADQMFASDAPRDLRRFVTNAGRPAALTVVYRRLPTAATRGSDGMGVLRVFTGPVRRGRSASMVLGIDGDRWGRLRRSSTDMRLPAGAHQVQIDQGGEVRRESVRVVAGRTLLLDLTAPRRVTSGTGEQRVRGAMRMRQPELLSGEYDRRLLNRHLRRRQTAFMRCYERQLVRNPTLRGDVTVTFTIEERGRVAEVHADADPSIEAAVGCVVSLTRRLRFEPGPEGPATLRVRMSFAPRD